MNILNKIKKYFLGEVIKIQHPFFGELIVEDFYCIGEKYFKPIDKKIEIGLLKTEKEFEEKQIEFFLWLEENFELIIEKITPSIEERLSGWVKNYKIENFRKEFLLEYIFIPKCDEKVLEWKISFWMDNKIQHWCSLDMKGLEVEHIMIDG